MRRPAPGSGPLWQRLATDRNRPAAAVDGEDRRIGRQPAGTGEPDEGVLAAAVLTGGEVTVTGWPARTTQPGDQLRDIFTRLASTGLTRG